MAFKMRRESINSPRKCIKICCPDNRQDSFLYRNSNAPLKRNEEHIDEPMFRIPEKKTKAQKKSIKIFSPNKKRYCQPPIPQSYAPKKFYQQPHISMEDNSTYGLSYKPIKSDVRSKPIRPIGNLFKSTAKMLGDTIHKLSYLPNQLRQIRPYVPTDSDFLGKGPMQDLTTHKHDFTPKPFNFRSPFKPFINLCLSKRGFEDKTVNALSYTPPGVQPVPKSYAPILKYKPPSDKMECATVQKLSYRPNSSLPRWIPKWHIKSYVKPTIPFAKDTIYKSSFAPPGWECEDDDFDGRSSIVEERYD